MESQNAVSISELLLDGTKLPAPSHIQVLKQQLLLVSMELKVCEVQFLSHLHAGGS